MTLEFKKNKYQKKLLKTDKNALVADKTEVFNLRGSQTKTFFPQQAQIPVWQI